MNADVFKGSRLVLERLEFENGRLVKVDGFRPEYMSGYDLIHLVGALAVQFNNVIIAMDRWKAMCRANAAALNLVEEAVATMLPTTIRADEQRGPEPEEQARDIIEALHKLREQLA